LVSALVAVAACGVEAPEPGRAPGVTQQAIFGGTAATTCQWPTTVLLSGCTGTLVHPLIVTTAAHCGTGHRNAIFGETSSGAARRIPIEYCRVFQTRGSDATDFAFCKLRTPVTDVPIIPPLMGCEVDILKPGQKVVVAGFGDNNDNNGGFGTKRWVETTLNRPDTGRGAQVGGMGKAPCFGDSGGPAFVKLADGSWRAFGIDSSGTGASCGAGDIMAMIYKAVPWIEQQSGIDITPCHDADGKWNPGPNCHGFSMDPLATGRTWATGCAEPVLSPPAATCGMPGMPGDGGFVVVDAGPAVGDGGRASEAGTPGDAGSGNTRNPDLGTEAPVAVKEDAAPTTSAPDAAPPRSTAPDAAPRRPPAPEPDADVPTGGGGSAGAGCHCAVGAGAPMRSPPFPALALLGAVGIGLARRRRRR
jgi:MYXO-CTERM domain-containing protein